jgi:hypothetical protein
MYPKWTTLVMYPTPNNCTLMCNLRTPLHEVETGESTSASSLDDFGSLLAPASIEALAKVIAALQGRDKPMKGKPDAIKHNPCSHCGSKRHSDRGVFIFAIADMNVAVIVQ